MKKLLVISILILLATTQTMASVVTKEFVVLHNTHHTVVVKSNATHMKYR